jgi:hypothetical protein
MREWFEAQLAAGFPAFAGSRVSGTLSVKQELLNELIAKWLAGADAVDSSRLELNAAKRAIKSANVRAEAGTVLVDFEIRI